MLPTDERFLRGLTQKIEEDTLVHQASRQLRREADERAARLGVELARERRDTSAARVSTVLGWVDELERRSTARDARIVDGDERRQPLWSSVVRVCFRVALVWSLLAVFGDWQPLAALIPLIVLWLALVLPERR